MENISELTKKMDEAYGAHDIEQALAAADAITSRDDAGKTDIESAVTLYIDEKQPEKAQQALDKAIQKYGGGGYDDFLQARIFHLNMDYERAIDSAEKALRDDSLRAWQRMMTHNILGRLYREIGEIDASLKHYLATSRVKSAEKDTAQMFVMRYQDYGNYLFNLHYTNASREELFAAAKKFGDFFAKIKPYRHKRKRRHEKIRVGYISPDLRYHVAAFFSTAFFKNYDRLRFDVYCYANCKEDEVSRSFAANVTGWRNIRYDKPAEAAKKIYDDEIDILVDLSGHTGDSCVPVLAYKPAPVIVSGVGYFDTTGLRTVDYFLADNYTDPAGLNEKFFTEKLLRHPHSHFCFAWYHADVPYFTSPYRDNGFVTFGSFNNFAKVNDEVLAAWAKILKRVPNSRLFLKAFVFKIAYGEKKVRERLTKAGIDLSRVTLEGSAKDYLDRYYRIDIALDTFPYPGGGTTCDALYMGVPVVSLAGERHNSRFGCSLLMNLGLGELCAFSVEEYIEKAVALANDPERISMYHQTLQRKIRQSPIMDVGLYMAETETLYENIFADWLYVGNIRDRQKQYDKDYADMMKAFAAEDWQAMIPCAARIAAAKNAPPPVFSALGKAYRNIDSMNCQRRAKYWLQKATAFAERQTADDYAELGAAERGIGDFVGECDALNKAAALYRRTKLPAPIDWRQMLCRIAVTAMQMGESAAAYNNYLAASEVEGGVKIRAALYSSMLLAAQAMEFSSEEMFALHTEYQKFFASVVPYTHDIAARREEIRAGRKIRIGYLSPDFRRHVMFNFYYGLLACCDRKKFAVYCYSSSDNPDGYTEHIKQTVDGFFDVHELTYKETAEKIYADGIDILVDLAGHSVGSALPVLAYKPAPVGVSGIGYLATTGLTAVDYFITDEIVDPSENLRFLVEKPLYLKSQFGYAGRSDVPEPQGAPCKTWGFVLFGVFNHYRKITDEMLVAWREIMARTKNSKLLLKSSAMNNDAMIDIAWARLKKLGFDMDRVIFEKSSDNYMERYLSVDIALDTYPYTGGGTTFDALYMGVPVVTRFGERRNTRFGFSILSNIGLGELASDNVRDYVEKACALAADRDFLDALHREIRPMLQNSPAVTPAGYAKNMEARYIEILGL